MNTPSRHHGSHRRESPGARRLCALTLLLLAGFTQAAEEPSERFDSYTAAERAGTPGKATGGFELGRFQMIPYASARYTRESNVFRFSREVAEVTETDETADRVQRYVAGLDTRYSWQRQQLVASIEGRSFAYDTHPHLDHDERLLLLSYAGSFYTHIAGMLDLSDERRMASFEDRRSTDLVIERERVVRGGVGVAVKPHWRVIGGISHGLRDSPLPEAPALPQSDIPARPASPDFELQETAIIAGVQYGIENLENPELEAPLLLRLVLEHETVRFRNFVTAGDGQSEQDPLPPLPILDPSPDMPEEDSQGERAQDYRLLGLEATAQYAVSGLSTLNASLGVAGIESLVDGDTGVELTGELSYTRDLTAVTQLSARVFRNFSPFVPSASVTIDTGFGVGARWEPILDIALLLDYGRSQSKFGEVGGESQENSGREDTTQTASFSLVYSRIEYFGLRLFGARHDRDSNRSFNDYSDHSVGAELSFRWE